MDSRDIERFWSKVDRSGGPDACWPWLGYRSEHGYGTFSMRPRRMVKAHRVAFLIVHGRWPLVGRHTCDNPGCANPGHVLDGTQGDNVADMQTKNRRADFGGERNGRAKLTTQDADCIRKLFATGIFTRAELARPFGVSPVIIGKVVRGDHWACS